MREQLPVAADEPNDDRTQSFIALTSGISVSHYKIIEKIGSGGMGEVYLAEDTKLNRKVALKFLPHRLCQDEDCRKRFMREAQAAAKLSNPNIIHIYEVLKYQNRPFFAMEHIEGQSLKDYSSNRELSIEQILEIGIQICEGLNDAHENGVIHRDIKPSNILIDSHGRVKIVDFGLASVVGSDKVTKTGSTLGTIGYMSPEQVQGKDVDRRSDLFSLGVVLYELITKQNPFKRESDAATLKAVSDDTPHPMERYRSNIPYGLQSLIEKALEKCVGTRYQHAADIRVDLVRLSKGDSESSWPTKRLHTASRKRWSVALTIMFILVAAAVLFMVYKGVLDKPSRNVPIHQSQLTSFGDISMCDIAPDGSYIAYVRYDKNKRANVFVKDMLGSNPICVFSDDVVWGVRWSPNGSEILISSFSDSTGGLKIISRLGGKHRKCFRYSIAYNSMSWSPDGERIAACLPTKKMYIIEKQSGRDTMLLLEGPFEWTTCPQWSPDGKWIAFSSHSLDEGSIWLINSEGGIPIRLAGGCDHQMHAALHWSPADNCIYYLNRRQEFLDLMKAEVDLKKGSLKGEPKLVISNLEATGSFSMTADGNSLLYTKAFGWSNLWKVDWKNSASAANPQTEQLTEGTALIVNPDISPNGEEIAYSKVVAGERHIFKKRFDGSQPVQLTFSNSPNWSPAWSSDGTQIAYTCWGGETYHLAVIQADGSAPRLFDNCKAGLNLKIRQVWWGISPRIQCFPPDNRNILLVDPDDGDVVELVSNDSVGWITKSGGLSPSGEEIAVHWNRYGMVGAERVIQTGTWLISMIDSSQSYILSDPLFEPIGWSQDGIWIYGSVPGYLVRIDRSGKNIVDTILPYPHDNVIEVTKGQKDSTIVYVKTETHSDVWLVNGLSGD